MSFRILLSIIFSVLSCLALFGQETTLQDVNPAEIQKRASELLDNARKLSDIRSDNAHAFKLTATFSFVGKDLETVHGAYTEIWSSKLRWRRETVVQNWRRIEVGSSTGSWLLDDAVDFPEPAAMIPKALEMFPANSSNLVFASIEDHKETILRLSVR